MIISEGVTPMSAAMADCSPGHTVFVQKHVQYSLPTPVTD